MCYYYFLRLLFPEDFMTALLVSYKIVIICIIIFDKDEGLREDGRKFDEVRTTTINIGTTIYKAAYPN